MQHHRLFGMYAYAFACGIQTDGVMIDSACDGQRDGLQGILTFVRVAVVVGTKEKGWMGKS